MKFANAVQSTLVLLSLAAVPAAAQDLFALPAPPAGVGSPAPAAISYAPATLQSNGQFALNPGAFRVISNANGSKFYVLTNVPLAPLYSVSNNYTDIRVLPGAGAVTGAVLTPDGSTLYVIQGGGLSAFNTSNDSVIQLPALQLNTTVTDLDASIDGTQVFVLLSSVNGPSLEAISNISHAVLKTIIPPATPSAVVVGPNGLIYVSAVNTILEIDPNSYQTLHQYTINGTPGKLTFTPDGHYAIANNTLNNGTFPAITLIDLFGNQVAGTIPSSSLPAGVVLNNVWPINSTTALGYVTSSQQLYTISLSPLSLSRSSLISSLNTTNKPIVGVAVSSDVAAGAHTTTQYLFYATSGTIQQITLSNGGAGTGVFTPVLISGISYTTPGLPSTPAVLLQYGNNQQVGLGGTSQPVVVRAVDSNGNPCAGVSVAFSGPAGVRILNPSVTTNMLGYASTTFVAPLTAGNVNIQAQTALGVGATFGATVGASTAGSGIPASLLVVAGQGQLAYEVTLASAQGAPMSVAVYDANGNALPNIPVTFELTKGVGSLVLYQGLGSTAGCAPTGSGCQVVVPTDKDGIASTDMVTHSVPQIPGFDSEVITASISSGLSTPIYFTTVSRSEPATVQLKAPTVGTIYSGAAGTTVKGAFQFQIYSNSGPGLPNISLQMIPSGDPTKTASASCAGSPLSNAQGLVTCDLVFGGILGISQVTPEVGDFQRSLPFTISVTAGPPAAFVKKQGDNQTAKPGKTLPLALIANLTDAYGNILTNTPVTWSVTSGTALISQSTQATDKNGATLAYVTLGPLQGTSQITVSAGPASAPAVANFTENAVVVPGGLKVVSGDNQSANVGDAFNAPLVIQALDDSNNPVQGVTVSFAVTSGGVTLSATSAVTDVNGNANVTATAPAAAGASVVTATFGSFSVTFDLNAIFPGPANISFVNGASFQMAGSSPGAVTPGEIVTILGDNLTPGVSGLMTPSAGALPTTLGGVQVLFGGVAAPLFAVVNQNGNEQINALVPFELGGVTSTSVTITTTNGSATFLNVPVQPLSPAYFLTSSNGQSYAVLVKASDGSYVSPQNLAKPGDQVIAFVNGLGQAVPVISSDTPGAGQAVNAAVTVTVNGHTAQNVSAVYQSQAYGIYLVSFQVPTVLHTGIYPLTLSAVGPDSKTYAGPSTFIPVGQ